MFDTAKFYSKDVELTFERVIERDDVVINCLRPRSDEFNIIPVASWCVESDFEWCFDGLSENSSIAITTNGCMSSPYGKRMLLRGGEELQKQKSPTNLIVCGRHVDELDIYDNVHYYPSFSQRWKKRAV